MARLRPALTAAAPPKGFIASAVNLPVMDRNVGGGNAKAWQRDAWMHWENLGELRYPTTWVGNVMGQAKLMAAKRDGNELVPQEKGPAREAMDELFGGPQGQVEMLQALGVHLSVAGEGFPTFVDDKWYVLASGKVKPDAVRKGVKPRVKVDIGKEGGFQYLGPKDFAIRVWTPHPRNPQEADSPVRANLNTLAQIAGYDAHINAQLQSRLTGGGILFLPSEVDFPVPPDADPNANQAQLFLQTLGLAMMTPKSNPSDPSAIVPMVVMVPGEFLGKAEHMKFWSELDDKVILMREAGIKRLALGIDVPPEILLGVADSNHWNAWLSEESAIKAHLEPKLGVVDHALTGGYLRPALKGVVPDPEEYFVIADTSSIRLRPNRSKEAIELYDKGELSGSSLRRETGFDETDKPKVDELKTWILRKIAIAASSPEASNAALRELGVDLEIEQPLRPVGDNVRTDTVPDIPIRELPTRPEDGLAAAAMVLVFRALERAGNRLRNQHPLSDAKAMPVHTVHMALSGDPDYLLAGAWDCAPQVLQPYCDDVVAVVDVLDFYTRGLIASKRAPSDVVLGTLLKTRPTPLEA